jgi:hypothetical protein
VCNAEVDYTIYKQAPYSPAQAQPLWEERTGTACSEHSIAQSNPRLSIRKDDPAGEYKVKAKVSDLNAYISFELETKFRLNEIFERRGMTSRWTGARIARSSTCALVSTLLLIAAPGQLRRSTAY